MLDFALQRVWTLKVCWASQEGLTVAADADAGSGKGLGSKAGKGKRGRPATNDTSSAPGQQQVALQTVAQSLGLSGTMLYCLMSNSSNCTTIVVTLRTSLSGGSALRRTYQSLI